MLPLGVLRSEPLGPAHGLNAIVDGSPLERGRDHSQAGMQLDVVAEPRFRAKTVVAIEPRWKP